MEMNIKESDLSIADRHWTVIHHVHIVHQPPGIWIIYKPMQLSIHSSQFVNLQRRRIYKQIDHLDLQETV